MELILLANLPAIIEQAAKNNITASYDEDGDIVLRFMSRELMRISNAEVLQNSTEEGFLDLADARIKEAFGIGSGEPGR